MLKVVGLAAAVTLAGAAGVVTAPSASAAETWTIYLCTGSGVDAAGSGPQTVYASPGDTVVLENNCAGVSMVFGFPSDSAIFAFPATSGIPTGDSSSAAVVGLGTGVQVAYVDGSQVPVTTVTVVSSTRAAAIPDWIQAYGRSGPDADCPSGYNPEWAGGPGADVVAYSRSWQQWMNDGSGGWVCTRSVPSLG